MKLIFEIPILNVVITFGITGFTVDLPYKFFGNNTEGHCGRSIFMSHFHFFFKQNFFLIIVLKGFEKNTYWNVILLTGTCNNNQADDCRLPSGQLVPSCSVMADYWVVEDISHPECQKPVVPPTSSPEAPPTPPTNPCTPDSMCEMLNSRYTSPNLFLL